MDAIFCIPGTDLTTVGDQTVAAMVGFLYEIDQFLGRFGLGKLRGDDHSGIVRIAAKSQNVVNILLRQSKSGAYHWGTLRFFDIQTLFFFSEEKGDLLRCRSGTQL